MHINIINLLRQNVAMTFKVKGHDAPHTATR